MKILVIGAGGQLGRCIADQLIGVDQEIILASRSEIDITDFYAARIKISHINPDVVINASAYTAVDRAESEPEKADLINHLAVAHVAKVCAEIESLLIHVSTDYVFDGVASSPYKEDEQTNPQGVYGKTKLLGELAIIQSGCKYVIIRTAWVFSEYGDNFLKTMLRLGSDRETLSIIYDQIGCPTYAQDLAQAITCIIIQFDLKNVKSGIYHYCGNKACSWFDFATIIFLAAKNEGYRVPECLTKITLAEYRALSERPLYSALDCSKIKTEFGIQPSDWSKGIRSAIKAL
jgi:dTDP-4-dehydrorhamnose reductase